MFRRNEKYLLRDSNKRTLLIKYKYFYIIQKSLLHNRLCSKSSRVSIKTYLLKKNLHKKYIKNLCTLSGTNISVNKRLMLSRYNLNYLTIAGQVQNHMINSW